MVRTLCMSSEAFSAFTLQNETEASEDSMLLEEFWSRLWWFCGEWSETSRSEEAEFTFSHKPDTRSEALTARWQSFIHGCGDSHSQQQSHCRCLNEVTASPCMLIGLCRCLVTCLYWLLIRAFGWSPLVCVCDGQMYRMFKMKQSVYLQAEKNLMKCGFKRGNTPDDIIIPPHMMWSHRPSVRRIVSS